MPPVNIPPNRGPLYGKNKWGVYGQLGEGANVQIRFVQTVIHSDELENLKLISHIPESHKWDVRNLFQRDVDGDRVKNDILPYFHDNRKVKFFNPLTLVLLPHRDDHTICKEINYLPLSTEKEDGKDWDAYEHENYYKLKILKNDQGKEEFAELSWNELKCYVVAIDGQHRLSALMRWQNQPAGDLLSWKIPVVILVLSKVDQNEPSPNLLEVVKKTFVYINTRAERLQEDREILLNDESVNAVCTQELIQFSHQNDCKPIGERDESIMPLIFYDWRAEVKDNKRVEGPASIKGIKEIHSWFEMYVLDEDGATKQESELHLTDLIPPLEGYGKDKTLTSDDTKTIRKQFRELVMPGILYFLQNFKPYAEYIAECRRIEREYLSGDDTSQFAFTKLRFGTHNASQDLYDEVNARFRDIVEELTDIKHSIFPEILSRDIGMRGIMCAFSKAKRFYNTILMERGETALSWLDFATKFTPIFNDIYDEGWFKSFNDIDPSMQKLLTHIIYDPAGSIVNYRIDKAENAFGAFLLILALNKERKNNETIIDEDSFESVWGEESNSLRKTVQTGLRKFIRAELRNTFVGTVPELNAEVTRQSEVKSTEQIQVLREWIENNG